MSEIAATWIDGGGGQQIAIRFSSSLEVTYTPDTRSPEQYADDVAAFIAEDGGPFKLIDLRGTKAMAKEADAAGPASISWVEKDRLIALIGYGGESLDDLISIATDMSA